MEWPVHPSLKGGGGVTKTFTYKKHKRRMNMKKL